MVHTQLPHGHMPLMELTQHQQQDIQFTLLQHQPQLHQSSA
jgi:hypothetical protein